MSQVSSGIHLESDIGLSRLRQVRQHSVAFGFRVGTSVHVSGRVKYKEARMLSPQVRLWSTDTGHCAYVYKHDQNNVSSCAWQPDSRHFVVGTVDRYALTAAAHFFKE